MWIKGCNHMIGRRKTISNMIKSMLTYEDFILVSIALSYIFYCLHKRLRTFFVGPITNDGEKLFFVIFYDE